MEKKRVTIIISVTAAVIVIGLIVFINIHNSPANRFSRAVENKNYTEAWNVYREGSLDKEYAIQLILERIEEIENQFNAGEIDLEEARNQLYQPNSQELSETESRINDSLEYLDLLADSKVKFEEAETYYVDEDYVRAISLYEQVSESDSNYADAQEHLSDAKTKLHDKALDEANIYIKAGMFSDAIELLTPICQIMPDDSELNALLTNTMKEQKDFLVSKALSEAEKYAEQENYTEALKILQVYTLPQDDARIKAAIAKYTQALHEQTVDNLLTQISSLNKDKDYKGVIMLIREQPDDIKNDSKVHDALVKAEDKFATQQIKEADKFAKKGQYAEAEGILKAALDVLPGNESLTDKLEKLIASEPVSIKELLEINKSYDVTWNSGSYQDVFGNDYHDKTNYCEIDTYKDLSIYDEFRLERRYKRLTGIIAPSDHFFEYNDGYAFVQIYADDKLVYISKNIYRKTDPFMFDINVRGVDYVKFVFVRTDQGQRRLILADVLVYPDV